MCVGHNRERREGAYPGDSTWRLWTGESSCAGFQVPCCVICVQSSGCSPPKSATRNKIKIIFTREPRDTCCTQNVSLFCIFPLPYWSCELFKHLLSYINPKWELKWDLYNRSTYMHASGWCHSHWIRPQMVIVYSAGTVSHKKTRTPTQTEFARLEHGALSVISTAVSSCFSSSSSELITNCNVTHIGRHITGKGRGISNSPLHPQRGSVNSCDWNIEAQFTLDPQPAVVNGSVLSTLHTSNIKGFVEFACSCPVWIGPELPVHISEILMQSYCYCSWDDRQGVDKEANQLVQVSGCSTLVIYLV